MIFNTGEKMEINGTITKEGFYDVEVIYKGVVVIEEIFTKEELLLFIKNAHFGVDNLLELVI